MQRKSKITELQENIEAKKADIASNESTINTLNTSLAMIYHRKFPVTIGQLSDALTQSTSKNVRVSLDTNVVASGIVPNVEDVVDNINPEHYNPQLFVNITLTEKDNDDKSYEADYIKFSTHLPSRENIVKFGYTKFAGSEPNFYDRSVLCVNPDRELPIEISMKTITSSQILTDAMSLIGEIETTNEETESEM